MTIYAEKGPRKMRTDKDGNRINPFPLYITLNVKDGETGQSLIGVMSRNLTRRQSTTFFAKVERTCA